MNPSRGNCITAYSPAFAKGAKVFSAQLSGVLTGVVSAGITAPFIGSAAVTKEKIGANAVRSEKISAKAITSAKIRAAFLSGTISGLLSGVIAVAHGLGVKPKMVVVTTLAAHADVVAGREVFLAAASAATTTNIYLKASKSGNVKYVAYVQL